MADKKDGSSSKGGAGTGDTSASSGKKPKPLLDLKATEVRGKPTPDTARAPTSTLKGAPGWKEPTSKDKSGSAADASSTSPSRGTGSVPSTSDAPSSSTPTGASSTKPATPSSRTGSVDTISASAGSSGVKEKSSSVPPTSAATGAARQDKTGDSKTGDSKSGDSKSGAPPSASKPASSAARAPAPKRSGGGFVSTLSHLAAGIVGGGIALFAAEPVGKQFGFALSQPPQVPAALERRLAALEARPTQSSDDAAIRKDVAQLSDQVAAAEKRLAELTGLGKQVASLADDVEKVRVAGVSNSGAAASGGADDAQANVLRARLAKLESAMATLSSATTAGGEPSGIAPLAKFSARFADLEGSLNSQLGGLRKSLMTEMDNRLAQTADATAKAVAGAERLDRELADIKTDAARLDQRATVLKTASDKLAATTRAISEQSAELKVELDALKGDVKQELAKVARPSDVQQAIAPVTKKVASIEKNLVSVLANETARKANAERIVLSLELSNLKRVLDRGAPYGAELDDVKKIAGDVVDVGSLEAHKSTGVPSGQELTRQFSSVAFKIISAQEAPKDDSRINQLLAAAKSIVQVRRTDIPVEEKTAEAAVARIEKRLKDGDMSGALALADKLPEQAKTPARAWMSQLAARAGVDRAIAKIEEQLKASLGGAKDSKS